MRAILCSILLVAAAGGCKSKSEPTTPPGDTAGSGDHHNEADHSAKDHEALTPELTAFHDVLAPLWHSEAPDRAAQTCESSGDLLALGAKVQDAGTPEGAAEDWKARVTTFMLAIDHMKEGCQTNSADFDANFTAVHDGFHALMEALPKG